jgi:hypothetical protein
MQFQQSLYQLWVCTTKIRHGNTQQSILQVTYCFNSSALACISSLVVRGGASEASLSAPEVSGTSVVALSETGWLEGSSPVVVSSGIALMVDFFAKGEWQMWS